MIRVCKIAHASYETPDLDQQIEYYTDIIGLTLAAEEKDRAELRRLRKQLKPFEETTLWALIVDLVLLDTEKHTRILRFISDHIA